MADLQSPKPLSAGANAHIYQHCVANRKPSTLRHRILFRLEDGRFRLYRPEDPFDPSRAKGPTVPDTDSLPERWRPLAAWYESTFAPRKGPRQPDLDPILALRGQGQRLWNELGGDKFIASLRQDWFPSAGPRPGNRKTTTSVSVEPAFPKVWRRITRLAGKTFLTRRQLPFRYEIEGDFAVRIDRDGHPINRQLWRGDFEKAWQRRPLTKTTQLRDLQGYAYIFGILTDKRVASSRS